MNPEEPNLLNSHHREVSIPALSKSGSRALALLRQGRNKRKLKYPSQVVSAIDPPDFRIKGNICSVIRDDYFAPETGDGDYSKIKYDGCDFSLALLCEALSQITPGGEVVVTGKGIFRTKLCEWGYGWDERNDETIDEKDIKITLVLSRNKLKATLLVESDDHIYIKIEQKTNLLPIILNKLKPRKLKSA